jgi:hypothetical protein
MHAKTKTNGAAHVRAPETEIVEVTPQLAASWLERNHPENRAVNWPRVEVFANDMRAGAWRTTHQGLAFDEEGRLIDGQHRLHAIVSSRVPVQLLVVRGVGSFGDPIDCGRTRSLGMLSGFGNRVTSCVNGLRMLEAGMALTSPMSLHEAREVHSHHAEWIEAIEKLPHMGRQAAGFWAACVYALPIDPPGLRAFVSQVATGEMLRRGDPAFSYRSWAARSVKIGIWPTAMAALSCIRYALAGKPIANVYTEPFSYRVITAKRRAMRLPFTPPPALVPLATSAEEAR